MHDEITLSLLPCTWSTALSTNCRKERDYFEQVK